MTVPFTIPISLIGRAATAEDTYGDDVLSDAPPVVVAGVFYPGTSGENTEGQDQVITQPTVYLPDVDLTAVDAVIVNGVTYEVDGDPLNWPANPFTAWRSPLPLQVPLRKVSG